MKCKVCQQEAVAACGKCGGFYCARHGGPAPLQGPRCVPCYDDLRGFYGLAAVVQAAIGVGLIFLAVNASQFGDRGQIFWLFPLFAFGMAFISGWSALRRFPE